jgi:ubiquinone/menaquinone biosynthesis C-methylase UbiE
MNDLEHAAVTADPALRMQFYEPMVRRYYECVTAVYRHFWGDSYHFALFQGTESRQDALLATERMVAEEGSFRKGLSILDVGCGLGGPALNIAEYSGADITGVDLCEHHVRIAAENAQLRGLAGRVRFMAADGMHLPIADATFDRVYVFESGCHMPDKEAFCLECARVLRAGGQFLGLDWMQRDGLTLDEQERYVEPICRYCSLPSMISPAMMSKHLEAAGFDVVVSQQASQSETLLRNWEPAQQMANAAADGWDREALQRVSLGGSALSQAARVGAFIIGYWRARKRE